MKATLLVNLKIGRDTIVAGRSYDDSVEPFPSFIGSNLRNPKVVRLTEGAVKEVKLEEPVIDKTEKVVETKPALKKKK